jgi:hypothetical protein
MANLILNGSTSGSVTLSSPAVSVYWIHNPEHTDMFTQGYIVITKDIKKRWSDHAKRTANNHLLHAIKKYGWDSLVKEVVLVADEAYCLMVEAKLRAEDKIGWNIIKGGGMPPHINVWNKGRKIPQEKLDSMKAKGFGFKKGYQTWNKGIKLNEEQLKNQFSLAEFVKENGAWNKGKPMLPHVKEILIKSLTGKIQSEESKLKKSLANKGRVFEKVTCPHCNTIGGLTAMKRWHMDNCKNKGIV